MHALIFAAMAAATTVGVDVGWQPAPDGGLEYIIQIEPEALEQLRAGHELAVGIRPELRDVRRYRIIVGDGPLPRETLRPEAADFSTEGVASPAVATENANPYRMSYEGASSTALPDLLAQANTFSADPIDGRYGTTVGGEVDPSATPRFSTPSRYGTTPGINDTGSTTVRTLTPSTAPATSQAYDWFSERFGGAGSINVPLLYTADASNSSPIHNPNSEGWSSTNPNAGPGTNVGNNQTPITGLPNPPGNTQPNTNNSNNYYANDPRYSNSNLGSSGPILNPPSDTGLPGDNRPLNNSQPIPGSNWPTGQAQPNQLGYGNNSVNLGNGSFPVAPAPANPNNPYASGTPYQVGQQQPYPVNNNYVYGYPQQQGAQPQGGAFGQGMVANQVGSGASLANSGAPLEFGQTSLDFTRANTPLAGTATKEPESKPWAFLIMTLFGLFASLGMNLYLGWNFYDARLRYLDLLDSLRRRGSRGAGASGNRLSSGSDIAERYSAA